MGHGYGYGYGGGDVTSGHAGESEAERFRYNIIRCYRRINKNGVGGVLKQAVSPVCWVRHAR